MSQAPRVRGWLLVLCLILTFSGPVSLLIATFAVASVSREAALMTGAFAITMFVTGARLWMRETGADWFAKAVMIACPLVTAYYTQSLRSAEQITSEAALGNIVNSVVWCAMWFLYLHNSKRVKATFPKERVQPQGAHSW